IVAAEHFLDEDLLFLCGDRQPFHEPIIDAGETRAIAPPDGEAVHGDSLNRFAPWWVVVAAPVATEFLDACGQDLHVEPGLVQMPDGGPTFRFRPSRNVEREPGYDKGQLHAPNPQLGTGGLTCSLELRSVGVPPDRCTL